MDSVGLQEMVPWDGAFDLAVFIDNLSGHIRVLPVWIGIANRKRVLEDI